MNETVAHNFSPSHGAIKDHESQVSQDKINNQEIELKSLNEQVTRLQQEFDLVRKK